MSDENENENDEPVYVPLLEVHDGLPWYASADIWVVPGASAKGAPGAPVPGNNWVWARVWNKGNAAVYNATVNFYWSPTTTAVTRTTATLIGSAYVNVPANSHVTVCCPNAWTIAAGTSGHYCLVVEAYDPVVDPLLAPTSNSFNVTTDRHIAQRNVVVTSVPTHEEAWIDFVVVNPDLDQPRTFTFAVVPIDANSLSGLAQSLGWSSERRLVRSSTRADVFRQGDESGPAPCSEIGLGPGERALMRVRLAPSTDRAGIRAVAVVQRSMNEEIGGLLVVAQDEETSKVPIDRVRDTALLNHALAQRPALAAVLVADPVDTLRRLGVDGEALRCPSDVHDAYERGQRAAEAAGENDDRAPVDRLVELGVVAKTHLGSDYGVQRIPYGLRFVEQVPEDQNNMDWTATATFECVFGPGCHADVDG